MIQDYDEKWPIGLWLSWTFADGLDNFGSTGCVVRDLNLPELEGRIGNEVEPIKNTLRHDLSGSRYGRALPDPRLIQP